MQELDQIEAKRKQAAGATRENTKRTEGKKTIRGPLHGEHVGEGEKRRPSLGFVYWPVCGFVRKRGTAGSLGRGALVAGFSWAAKLGLNWA